jgi:hypothetical protein
MAGDGRKTNELADVMEFMVRGVGYETGGGQFGDKPSAGSRKVGAYAEAGGI